MTEVSTSRENALLEIVKTTAIFGRLPEGSVYRASGDFPTVLRKLKRDHPDENPMEWKRND